jgi:hypothetical protein
MVLALLLVLPAVVGAGWALHQRSERPTRPAPSSRPGPWLTLPLPPPACRAGDDWILEAFDAGEIAELRRLDEAVRRDLTHASHAEVLARVPERRRARRIRAMGWTAADLASTRAGRLTLELATGIRVELDGVSRSTADWLRYCHDQFGVVLEAISPTEATWAARLHSCGWITPVQASRLRVA